MAERIEGGADRADQCGPPILRQLVAVLAVELLPDEPRGSLGVDEQAVEVEEKPADSHAVSIPEWLCSASTWAGPLPTRWYSTAAVSPRPRSSPLRSRRRRSSPLPPRTSSVRTRWRPSSASTSALRRLRQTLTSGPWWRAICARCPPPPQPLGCPRHS